MLCPKSQWLIGADTPALCSVSHKPCLFPLGQWSLKCSSQTSSMTVAWDLVRSAGSQAHPWPTESKSLGVGLEVCVLTKPPAGILMPTQISCIHSHFLVHLWSSNFPSVIITDHENTPLFTIHTPALACVVWQLLGLGPWSLSKINS